MAKQRSNPNNTEGVPVHSRAELAAEQNRIQKASTQADREHDAILKHLDSTHETRGGTKGR